MDLTVSIYDKRIDSEHYHGFYHATFEVECHHSSRHTKGRDKGASEIIIDKIELCHVDYYDDKTELRSQMTYGSISRELKEYILAYLDYTTLREKIFDKAY